jgi:hypothetical protein
MLESKILAKYFRRTGLTQWTDATFVSAADLGRVFVRRLAKELEGGGGKLNERYLAELGVPKEQASRIHQVRALQERWHFDRCGHGGGDGGYVPDVDSTLRPAVDHET